MQIGEWFVKIGALFFNRTSSQALPGCGYTSVSLMCTLRRPPQVSTGWLSATNVITRANLTITVDIYVNVYGVVGTFINGVAVNAEVHRFIFPGFVRNSSKVSVSRRFEKQHRHG